jgi:hypothetical protein
MHHQTLRPADLALPGAILALKTGMTAAELADIAPLDEEIRRALDSTYGKGNRFLFSDEDLSGRPIRGTISLAYGSETLVIG